MHSTEEALNAMGIAGLPGAFLVDMFPSCENSVKFSSQGDPKADFLR